MIFSMMRSIATLLGLALAVSMPASAAELKVLVRDLHGKLVADAVVVATPSDPKIAQRAKAPADAIDQVDKQFVPYVKPVFVGSLVRFPNSDHIRHQVYSFSAAKKFELPLYAGTAAPPVVFDKPGVVVLGCNIHDWMVGYIYVSETPYFAKTGAAGSAIIGELPPGEYTIRVWHPGMVQSEESTSRRVTLNADAPSTVAWDLNLKPTPRVPRVSGAAAAGYP
jgi:plastocyanin